VREFRKYDTVTDKVCECDVSADAERIYKAADGSKSLIVCTKCGTTWQYVVRKIRGGGIATTIEEV